MLHYLWQSYPSLCAQIKVKKLFKVQWPKNSIGAVHSEIVHIWFLSNSEGLSAIICVSRTLQWDAQDGGLGALRSDPQGAARAECQSFGRWHCANARGHSQWWRVVAKQTPFSATGCRGAVAVMDWHRRGRHIWRGTKYIRPPRTNADLNTHLKSNSHLCACCPGLFWPPWCGGGWWGTGPPGEGVTELHWSN